MEKPSYQPSPVRRTAERAGQILAAAAALSGGTENLARADEKAAAPAPAEAAQTEKPKANDTEDTPEPAPNKLIRAARIVGEGILEFKNAIGSDGKIVKKTIDDDYAEDGGKYVIHIQPYVFTNPAFKDRFLKEGGQASTTEVAVYVTKKIFNLVEEGRWVKFQMEKFGPKDPTPEVQRFWLTPAGHEPPPAIDITSSKQGPKDSRAQKK